MVTLIAIGSVGLLFLLALLLLDDLFDLFDGEPVLPAIAVFAAMFGFSGALAFDAESSGGPQLYIPFIVGGGAALLFFLAYRRFKKLADDDESFVPDPQSMLGQPATVNWWNESRGEVFVTYLGHRQKIAAQGDEEFKSGDSVTVARVVSAELVEIKNTQKESE